VADRLVALVLAFGMTIFPGRFLVAMQEGTPTEPSLNQLEWMAGHWMSREGDRHSEEFWLPVAGGVMLGLNREVSPQGAFFEFLRIEVVEDSLDLVASPMGREPTRFRLAAVGDRRVVFANPGHNFPQTVSYWLDSAGRLNAEIQGLRGGEPSSVRWVWESVVPPACRLENTLPR